MLIDQISVFLSNQPGRLTDITGILSRANIDIRALSLADTTDFGILRLIVDNPSKAEEELKKSGLTVRKTKVIAAKLEDRPGSLHSVLKVLKENGISVEYAYAFLTPVDNHACVILRVEDNESAITIFKNANVQLLKPEEVYSI
jgi:hypothetical protein